MATTNVPNWKAAKDGIPGDLNATNHASQVDQLLGIHNITAVRTGVQLVQPAGGANFTWLSYGSATDFAQPFVMPAAHTAIGRVCLPLKPVGSGADVMVSLYPDNGSGSPNTSNLLGSTVIPASWLTNLSAPNGLESGGPLAIGRYNTMYMTGGFVQTTWAPPAGGVNGSGVFASQATSGNFIITAGGSDAAGSPSSIPKVFTSQYSGGGVEQLSVPQPSLPINVEQGTVMVSSSAVVYAGGITFVTGVGTTQNTVWTASWNPSTGEMGSWSSQTALPTTSSQAGGAVSGNNIYYIGGVSGVSGLQVNTVYGNSVTNGQLGSWVNLNPLPVSLQRPITAAVNGWLLVCGGNLLGAGSGDDGSTGFYYAKIQSDGSIGPWITGPSLPVATLAYNPGWNTAVTNNALALITGRGAAGAFQDAMQIMAVTADGPAEKWQYTHWSHATTEQYGFFANGDGSWDVIALNFPNNYYEFTKVIPVPVISVPLPVTGLSAGATYHVVVQQRTSTSASDYVQIGITNAALTNDALKSSRHSGTWSTAQTGYSAPMAVFDNSVSTPIVHTWEDPSSTGSSSSNNIASRASTFVYNADVLPVGVLESTVLPNDALNANPTFTSGVSNWTAHNCTFVQSNAQVHGGFSFSGLMTPNGVASAPNVTSELVPILSFPPVQSSAQWYSVNGWFYSPTGWSNVSASVDWYDSSKIYITTTNSTRTISAATWTNIVSYNLAPAGAAFASINIIEGSTPAAGNTLYFSNVMITAANEMTQTLSTVSQITYASSGSVQPTGVTQLA